MTIPASFRLIALAVVSLAGLAAMTVVGPGAAPDPTLTPPAIQTYLEPDPSARPEGRIMGTVRWHGPLPAAEPIYGFIQSESGSRWMHKPNTFAPKVRTNPAAKDEQGVVENVVAYLKGVDSKRAAPWARGPVRVEVDGSTVVVRQEERTSALAFAKLGDEIELVSRDANYHTIRARGAAFFTLPFPVANRPLRRKLERTGRIEFTSGAGYFWTAADVFVCDHPYYTVTDAAGKFTFDRVPPGKYEVVAWLRPWKIQDQDRDPETGRVVRLHFQDELEITGQVVVPETGIANIELTFPASR